MSYEPHRKVTDFKDLTTWQEGHRLVIALYAVTKKFPKSEQFGLTSQMRRAAVSVTSNIAEGFGRRSYKERVQFYYLSQGSLVELKNQILIARDVGYLSDTTYDELMHMADTTHQLLQGLISKSKSFISHTS